MNDIKNHLAFNRALEELDVVVVDDSKFQQQLIRTILQPLRLKRVRVFDNAKNGFANIQLEPPHLLLMDWRLEDMPGRKLIHALRNKDLGTSAFVSMLVTMTNPTKTEAEEAFRAGAQAVIAKPFSHNALQRRVQWIMHDARPLRLSGQHFVIDGVTNLLHEKNEIPSRQQDYKTVSEEKPAEEENKDGKVAA